MATKPNEPAEETTEQLEVAEESTLRRVGKRLLHFLGILLALGAIVAAGFFAGVYLRLFDVYEANEQLDQYALPFVSEYIVEPIKKIPGAFDEYIIQPASKAIDEKLSSPPPEAQPTEGEQKEEKKDEKKEEKKDEKKDDLPKPIKKEEESKPIVLTKEEIEKQQKEAEAAERKRVSKLAKLYNEMKPEAAADIMTDLDDEIAVAVLQKMDESQAAKVLASLDPGHSARLTRSIYTGRRSSMASPGDQMVSVPMKKNSVLSKFYLRDSAFFSIYNRTVWMESSQKGNSINIGKRKEVTR